MEGVFPESGTQIRGQSLLEAQWVMARALQIGEWERSMDHRSLLPYLREEVVEFEQAVRELDDDASEDNLLKELSDILLQVLFHAELARRRDSFDLDDVAAAFVSKMRSRAPYLFEEGDGIISIAEQERLWAEGKAQEKAQRPRE
ncbi:MazG nucleotide pyrophosphohydrolase domain-containing protein [Corynebacterium sp. H130]|uniref:MazG nucleotide pyrophosphohydrolase domain-containing protein n=1 Tax=Corynebacterium sp. H130 TaxID=3133444 RepID=UPI0030978C9F